MQVYPRQTTTVVLYGTHLQLVQHLTDKKVGWHTITISTTFMLTERGSVNQLQTLTLSKWYVTKSLYNTNTTNKFGWFNV